MQERRKYVRFKAEGNAIITPEDGSARTFKADLYNISFEGFSIETQEKIGQGTNIKFALSLNLWEEPVPGAGRIKYIHEIKIPRELFRIGIEFIEVDRSVIQYVVSRIQAEICAEARKKDTNRRKPF